MATASMATAGMATAGTGTLHTLGTRLTKLAAVAAQNRLPPGTHLSSPPTNRAKRGVKQASQSVKKCGEQIHAPRYGEKRMRRGKNRTKSTPPHALPARPLPAANPKFTFNLLHRHALANRPRRRKHPLGRQTADASAIAQRTEIQELNFKGMLFFRL